MTVIAFHNCLYSAYGKNQSQLVIRYSYFNKSFQSLSVLSFLLLQSQNIPNKINKAARKRHLAPFTGGLSLSSENRFASKKGEIAYPCF